VAQGQVYDAGYLQASNRFRISWTPARPLQAIISKPCEDPVNDKRVVADEIAVVGLEVTVSVIQLLQETAGSLSFSV